ncbi:MarR family winged helix-turn-helix transcriptional regulator [Leucobacter chromiireducens]|uniref:MarR family transcriptional regulator n=1 Tax=Leucobacter chromiireducens subsp. solipictus TaxID=398235 RepID=A0ABS1SJA7_9MICO|nr:MarR family transcriptional regulator [Leucobacter chromiireducens]MBL3680649.1 MarR family transcriptional regulator [Leucobacter chromiireducens subsp. solipictus]
MDTPLSEKHALLLRHTQQETEAAQLLMMVLRTAQLVDRACATQLAPFDLTEARFGVLLAAAEDPAATPARLAAKLDITRAAVTGLVDGLVRQGLVTRHEDPEDRRSLTVTVTLAGHATLAALGPRYGEWLSSLTAGLSPSDIARASAALSTIQHQLATQDPRG